MSKNPKLEPDKELKQKVNSFVKKITSNMNYRSEIISDSISFDWVDIIEETCPYIDNIVRAPKVLLVNETDVVKIEKAKKIDVDSVKDLAKKTHYIEKIDEKTSDVQPSKILITRREDTFNIYENRVIYTLIYNLSRFVLKKEELLEDFKIKTDKVLEYASSTATGDEKISIELKISSVETPKSKENKELNKEIQQIKERLKKIRDYIAGWERSEMVKALDKARVAPILPPIRKTNMILKNPNFQMAMKLWDFLQKYDDGNNSKDGLDTDGDEVVKDFLNDAFLMNYYVLDSISSKKNEQKEKMTKYAVIMINQQINRVISLLLNSGIDITEKDILGMISNEIDNGKNKRTTGGEDVKKKFKSVMEEYLERTQDYL